MVFCDNKDLNEMVSNHPGLEYYGYWNNTDKPEDLTDEQWEQRRTDWDTALGGTGDERPSSCGLIAELVNVDDVIIDIQINHYYDKVLQKIPALSTRLMKKASSMISTEKWKEGIDSGKITDDNYGSSFVDIRDYLNSKEGIAAVAKKMSEIERLLVPEYREEDLQYKLK